MGMNDHNNYATKEQFNALILAYVDSMRARDARLDYLYNELRHARAENEMLRGKIAELQELLKRKIVNEQTP